MKKLDQKPRYQKDANVKQKKITPEYKSIWKILDLIPKDLPLIDIACAEGFIVYMADQRGFNKTYGIEIDEGRVKRGRDNLGVNIDAADTFESLHLMKDYKVFVVSRFFHNVGLEKSKELMDAIDKNDDYIIINKHKPGPRKETGEKRELLATKKGINGFMEQYGLTKKSFSQDVVVAAKGKYEYIPEILRKYIPEPC